LLNQTDAATSDNSMRRMGVSLETLPFVIYAGMGALFLLYFQQHASIVSSTDSEAYVQYALRLRADGFGADIGNIRTYGYPALLWALSFFSGANPFRLVLLAGSLQLVLYGLAVRGLARSLRNNLGFSSGIVSCGLLLNPYIVSIVADVVSEAPSLTCHVGVLWAISHLEAMPKLSLPKDRLRVLLWFASGALLASSAVMLRPANLILLAAWFSASLLSLANAESADHLKGRVIASFVLLAGFICLLVWSPQILYNYVWDQRLSIFPGCPIGDLQITLGILNLKYDTLISAQGAAAIYFPNPWFFGGLPKPAWLWYFEHPFSGFLTMALHLFGALSINHISVYRHASFLPTIVPSLLGWMLNGIAFGWLFAGQPSITWLKRLIRQPILLFVLILMLGTAAVCAVSVVETRMALIPLATISVGAAYAIAQAVGRGHYPRTVLASIAVFTIIGTSGAAWMNSLAQERMASGNAGTLAYSWPCFHRHPSR
jgi:hypothetical protein